MMELDGILTHKKAALPERHHKLEIRVKSGEDDWFIQVGLRAARFVNPIPTGSEVTVRIHHKVSEANGRWYNNIFLKKIEQK